MGILHGLIHGSSSESGGSGGGDIGGGSPYQQLVTDGTGKAVWEDKPFGDQYGVVIEETEFNVTLDQEVIGDVAIEAGKTYTVIFDGVAYECTCEIIFNEYPAIGSLDATLEDYPFTIYYGYGTLLCLASEGVHTVKILGDYVKTISPAYLPKSVPTTKRIYGSSTNKEFNEAIQHFLSGGLLLLEDSMVIGAGGGINDDGSGTAIFIRADGRFEINGDGSYKKYGRIEESTDFGTVPPNAFYLRSYTTGSTKRFKITIDDSGTLTAKEV